MEMLVDTVTEDPRWDALDLAARAEAAARAVMGELGLPSDGFSIALLGCDDARIAVLNAEFRGKPVATNVLSWPSEERGAVEPGGSPDLPEPGDPDDPQELGDIAIAYDTCAREAAEQGKDFRDHVSHLIVHGILHLFGFDHVEDVDADVMEALEVRTLARLGVRDPY